MQVESEIFTAFQSIVQLSAVVSASCFLLGFAFGFLFGAQYRRQGDVS